MSDDRVRITLDKALQMPKEQLDGVYKRLDVDIGGGWGISQTRPFGLPVIRWIIYKKDCCFLTEVGRPTGYRKYAGEFITFKFALELLQTVKDRIDSSLEGVKGELLAEVKDEEDPWGQY